MYGSKKKDDTTPWRVEYEININTEDKDNFKPTLTHHDTKKTAYNPEYIKLFSIRNKTATVKAIKAIKPVKPMSQPVKAPLSTKAAKAVKALTSESNNQGNQETPKMKKEGFDNICSLVQCLNKKRSENYNDWIKLGWCLNNITYHSEYNKNALQLWIDFSRHAPSIYKDGECQNIWGGMRMGGSLLNEGTLHRWAKIDDPDAYNNYFNNKVKYMALKCNLQHKDMARFAFIYVVDKFVYGGDRKWYYFNGSLWKEDFECNILHKHLDKTIRKDLVALKDSEKQKSSHLKELIESNQDETNMARAQKDDMLKTALENKKSEYEHEIEFCDRNINHVEKMIIKLDDMNFSKKMIEALSYKLSNYTFIDELDTKMNLLAFNNEVWDFDSNCFRSSVPSDMVSLSVNYDYTPVKNEQVANTVRHYWNTLHPEETQRNYVLQMFARQLYGDKGGNLFHLHAGHKASSTWIGYIEGLPASTTSHYCRSA
jgi:hypothetical protein